MFIFAITKLDSEISSKTVVADILILLYSFLLITLNIGYFMRVLFKCRNQFPQASVWMTFGYKSSSTFFRDPVLLEPMMLELESLAYFEIAPSGRLAWEESELLGEGTFSHVYKGTLRILFHKTLDFTIGHLEGPAPVLNAPNVHIPSSMHSRLTDCSVAVKVRHLSSWKQ